ncbi:unnamed protein product [Nyctereutes procyonoides]|uniref:(raccoon dog) hypothetical protein n=1 Tax=Nyctereutes procyonoides TaxID=34880 RepID=A0A811ZY06_NYCPR|nr:unnamed protein product [Nyctereutes procyonoides]
MQLHRSWVSPGHWDPPATPTPAQHCPNRRGQQGPWCQQKGSIKTDMVSLTKNTKEDIFVHQTAIKKNKKKGAEAANGTGPTGTLVQGSKYAADGKQCRPFQCCSDHPCSYQWNYQNSESGGEIEGWESACEGQAPQHRPYCRWRFPPYYYRDPNMVECADNQGAGEQGGPVRQSILLGSPEQRQSSKKDNEEHKENVKDLRPKVSGHLSVSTAAASITVDAQKTLNHKMTDKIIQHEEMKMKFQCRKEQKTGAEDLKCLLFGHRPDR